MRLPFSVAINGRGTPLLRSTHQYLPCLFPYLCSSPSLSPPPQALKSGEPGWCARWFTPSGPNGSWRYSGGYWEQRAAKDWRGVKRIFESEEGGMSGM